MSRHLTTSLRVRAIAIGAAVLAASGPASAGVFTLDPGTIIGQDSVEPGSSDFTLVKWSQSGRVLDTLDIIDVPDEYGTMDGLAVLGDDVWTIGTGGIVTRVDLASGALTDSFTTSGSGPEALGTLGDDLLVGNFGFDTVQVYSTSGALLSSVALSQTVGVTGVDSDGESLFVASWDTGNIHVFDLAGQQQRVIPTGIGSQSLSGLGYDDATDTLWVSTGFGQDDIRHYDLGGTLLTSFDAGFPFIDGLDVVSVPGPAAWWAGVALVAAGRRRRRDRGQSAPAIAATRSRAVS
jgi:hypothetical protein